MSNSFATPWTVALQAPLSMEFSSQEYWSGSPFSSPDLPVPGIKPIPSALAGRFFTPESPGKELVFHAFVFSFRTKRTVIKQEDVGLTVITFYYSPDHYHLW